MTRTPPGRLQSFLDTISEALGEASDAARSETPAPPSPSDPAAKAQLDLFKGFSQARVQNLRNRLKLYCIVVMAVVSLSIVSNLVELLRLRARPDQPEFRATQLDLVGDLLLFLIFAIGLASGLVAGRSAMRIKGILTLITIAASLVVVLVEPLVHNIGVQVETGETLRLYNMAEGLTGLIGFLFLHVVLSLLIPLSPRESLRLVFPAWIVFALGLLAFGEGEMVIRAFKIAVFPFAAIPGVLISAFRYRLERRKFQATSAIEKYGELSQELSYAKRIHEALFPPPLTGGPVRVYYRYEPMREIGGDFLFVHPLTFPPSMPPPDQPVNVVVLDVSGHGIPAALTVNRLSDEMKRFFLDQPALAAGQAEHPAALLWSLNRFAVRELAPQAVFATGIAIRADPATRTVIFASAGHPPAYLHRAKSGHIEELASTGTMLGVIEDAHFEIKETEITLEPGDVLVLFTDGVFEAPNSEGAAFGLERVKDEIHVAAAPLVSPPAGDDEDDELHASPHSPKSISDEIADAVLMHRGLVVKDDVLVVEVSFDPPARSRGAAENRATDS